ncbi:kinase-like domain-containing protein [Aspergillus pseudoustus]|uniref:Kinase-like domain-containing protein n=1 Tax=Aspergillus pseudoustus TaxID=1810923 RepID=A0ABR4IQ03_9EURO
MEHMKYGSLDSHLSQPLPEDEVKHITLQVLEGLASLHENEFVHRDLKPDNILVASKGPRWWVKISDFGFSKRITEGSSLKSTVGTQNYFAPEILGLNTATIDSQAIESRYTCAVDMWSLGVTVFYMLCHAYPFKNRELLAYTQGAPFPTAALSLHHVAHKGQAFVKALLTVDASGRLPVKAALADQWFTGLKEDLRATEEVSFSGVVEAPVLSFTTASSRSWPMDSTVQTLMSELTISEPLNVPRRKRSPASRGNRDEKLFDTPRALHTEGADFLIRNEFKKAENLLRQAVDGREIALGPNHKDTLDSKLNLGRAYNGLSRYADAHKLLPQVVKVYGESLGPLHKDTLEARYELCDALCGLEEYQEAQDNLQDLIRIRVAISGEEDEFDIYLFDLASEIYYRRENYNDAANMYTRLLSLVRKIWGPDDSMIPPILEDLGRCRYYEQRYEEAEAIFQELVDIDTRTERTEEQALENILWLVESMNKQGRIDQAHLLLLQKRKYRAAQDLLQKAVQGHQRVLGPTHKTTLMSSFNLGQTLVERRLFAEGKEIFKDLEGKYRKVFGPRDLGTMRCRMWFGVSNLGCRDPQTGYGQLAIATHNIAEILGAEHEDTLVCKQYLGMALSLIGLDDKAEELLQNILPIQRKAVGSDAHRTMTTMSCLGLVLFNRKRYGECEILFREAAMRLEKLLGASKEKTLDALSNLAWSLEKQKKWDEALQVHQTVYNSRRAKLDRTSKETLESAEDIKRCEARMSGSTAEAPTDKLQNRPSFFKLRSKS